MAVGDAYVFPGFLTPVLTQLFFPKPPTTFLTWHVESYETNISNEKMTVLQEDYKNEPTKENDKNIYASYTGKYVVNFKEKLYVGFVEEVSDRKLLIECMRKIGKRNENLFSWPKKIKDKSWYSTDNIVSVVYEIRRKEDKNKFMIDEESWKYFLN